MMWTRIERKWLDALFSATLGVAAHVQKDFWIQFGAAAPAELRWGLRATTWLLTIMAFFSTGRPFHWLSLERGAELMNDWNMSRWYLVRQLVMTLKVVACFEYLGRTDVRQELGAAP